MSSLIISKTTKQVLIPFNTKIQALWPKAKTLEHNGTRYAIISHDPRSQAQLRAADIQVPAPILTQYNWEQQVPFETQKTTAALLTSNRRAYVLSDMGVGKTRAALWAWRYLNRVGCAKRLLIVCPLSTMKFVWQREISITLPGIKTAVLHGSKQQRLALLANSGADVFIVNHDGLRIIASELAARDDIDTLVIDELAVYRNRSLRSKHMQTFAQRFVWVWALTGRPMPNAPTDVFHQCRILTPGTVPKFFRHAQSMLMVPISQFKWVPKPGAVDVAYSWMQPNIRYALEDVVELPPFISRMIDVEMSAEQRSVYARVANEFAAMVKDQRITAANAGVAMFKLLQIASGFVYTTHPEYVSLDSTLRQDMLLELIDEAPEKVIVFAPFTHLVEETSKLLTHHKVDHAVVYGETTHREKIFNAFQNTSQYTVMLAHPQTLHHGVTLTSASTVIWLSPPVSLEIYEQANARIRRVSQSKKQQYFHLQSTSVEKKVYAGLRGKQRIQDNFLEMVRAATEIGNGL